MNWDIIASTGEWAGAIAVVATLFYLARQIHHQNTTNDVNTQESILEGFNAVNSLLAGSEELATLFLNGLYDPETLSDGQTTQFGWMFRLYMNGFLKIHRLHQKGIVSEEDWLGYGSQGADFLNTPGSQLSRNSHSGEGYQDFYDALEKLAFDEPGFDISLGRRIKQKSSNTE